jgi:uncharacterized protein YbjT (DUF2867 family)
MKVLVIGAHGKIGQLLVKALSAANHEPLAMIRKETQKEELQNLGAQVVIADLEGDLSPAFNLKPDVVVFTAGSGGHTGNDKTQAVDLQGAQKAIDAAKAHGVDRFIMVSALGADQAENAPEGLEFYMKAKSEADQYLVQSNLDYTILRPGMLTDENGTGSLQAAEKLENWDTRKISRANVANFIVHILNQSNTYEKVIEMLDGKKPLPQVAQTI